MVLIGKIIIRHKKGNREIAKIVDQFKQELIEEDKAIKDLEDKTTEINNVSKLLKTLLSI